MDRHPNSTQLGTRSGNFNRHLHNGDPLTSRTVHVPAGRPKSGTPPFTWEQSAVDALAYDGLTQVTDWSIEHVAYVFENFNGWDIAYTTRT
jgi:lysozyme family protein